MVVIGILACSLRNRSKKAALSNVCVGVNLISPNAVTSASTVSPSRNPAARVYRANRRRYADLVGVGTPEFPAGRAFPCLRDRYEAGGVASGHYFHQDLLVAQWLNAANPQRHIDVGSRVDGFVAHVAAFREI